MLQNVNLALLVNLIFMFSTGKFESSCTYRAVGGKVVISFIDPKLQEYYELRWTHNKVRVYFKKGPDVKTKELNVDRYGSLILENVQKNHSGEYIGVIFNKDGTLIKDTVQQLCVLEPVSEPTVMVKCLEKGLNLTCSEVNNDEVVSWMKNGITSNATHSFLHVDSSELKPGDYFSCTVSNKISKTSSKEVKPVCPDTGLYATAANYDKEKKATSSSGNENKPDVYENKFLGLELWLMLVILIGGGSFLILFIICLVCICCCYRRNKMKAKEEEEYRLTNLMPDHTNPPDVQYMQQITSKSSSKSQRPLPPLPSPKGPSCIVEPNIIYI